LDRPHGCFAARDPCPLGKPRRGAPAPCAASRLSLRTRKWRNFAAFPWFWPNLGSRLCAALRPATEKITAPPAYSGVSPISLSVRRHCRVRPDISRHDSAVGVAGNRSDLLVRTTSLAEHRRHGMPQVAEVAIVRQAGSAANVAEHPLEKAYRIFREQQVDFVCGRAYFIVDGTRRVGDFVTGSTSEGGPINTWTGSCGARTRSRPAQFTSAETCCSNTAGSGLNRDISKTSNYGLGPVDQ
jgi:hypothetical protein